MTIGWSLTVTVCYLKQEPVGKSASEPHDGFWILLSEYYRTGEKIACRGARATLCERAGGKKRADGHGSDAKTFKNNALALSVRVLFHTLASRILHDHLFRHFYEWLPAIACVRWNSLPTSPTG
jgi:hypothetical protein